MEDADDRTDDRDTRSTNSDTKHINLHLTKPQNKNETKPQTKTKNQTNTTLRVPRKKLASQKEQWIDTATIYSNQETQLILLLDMKSGNQSGPINILLTHLKAKHSGYRSQDTAKGFYDPARFVQVSDIVNLLIESHLSCFYCRKWTTLFYENVREPRQWSLERLSNAQGHNRDNVVIACLECNMRRRTMYYERYLATKQLIVNKLDSTEDLDYSGIDEPYGKLESIRELEETI